MALWEWLVIAGSEIKGTNTQGIQAATRIRESQGSVFSLRASRKECTVILSWGDPFWTSDFQNHNTYVLLNHIVQGSMLQ